MPINVLGMIGVARPQTESTVHIVGGGLDGDYVSDFARVHEESGFDAILIGHSSSSADGFLVAQPAAFHTDQIKICSISGLVAFAFSPIIDESIGT